MGLWHRIARVEQMAVEAAPPMPSIVRIVHNPADEVAALAEHAAAPKGTPLVLIDVECSRKCTDDCTGGVGCRKCGALKKVHPVIPGKAALILRKK